ncbi:Nn.00g011520.m01.CDS01 [Neocucurbitaria sp. VM-36]
MRHPKSPRRPSSADLPCGLASAQHSKDVFCASLPHHSQSSLQSSSPGLSTEVTPMATAVEASAPSRDHRASSTMMSLYGPGAMQWATPSNFSLDHLGEDTTSYHSPIQISPGSEDFYHCAQNDASYKNNHNYTYPTHYSSTSCPRSYTGLNLIGLHNGLPNDISMSESYPPAAYQIEPQKPHDVTDLTDQEIDGQLMQLSDDYEYRHYGPSIRVDGHSDYQSPYSDLTRDSTPHDELPGAIDKEQPYAQLIYKALLGAPDHTMILRDIYDWFKKYTDKASVSETKGWQNSIRHNLSMNGAFEKVDHPSEDSRKGFMWRLTDEAIREGVKSTTRYRSKQPNKRGHHTHHPQPQRQASGAKGGQAARRSARMRRSNRVEAYQNDPYNSRSVPAAFDPMYNTSEAPMPYPPSPYSGSEVDYAYGSKPSDFGTSLDGSRFDLFSPPRSYGASPMLYGMPMLDAAYMLDGSPTESLFTDSPSPPADEPRTPVSQGGWSEQESLCAPSMFGGLAYREYAG